MAFKDILSGNPELYEKVKNQWMVTERDMEHEDHESTPVGILLSSDYLEPRRGKRSSHCYEHWYFGREIIR